MQRSIAKFIEAAIVFFIRVASRVASKPRVQPRVKRGRRIGAAREGALVVKLSKESSSNGYTLPSEILVEVNQLHIKTRRVVVLATNRLFGK